MLQHARALVVGGLAWLLVLGGGLPAVAAGDPSGGTPGPQASAVTGSVVDVSGAPVPNALVTVTAKDGGTSEVRTDANGHFELPASAARISVTSAGLEPVEMAVPPNGGPLHVVMRPATFADTIVVTATRSEERLPSAASATVVTAAELSNMAAGALDDALRYTPGFTLFRRSSSRVANPTTQGVTLRGVSGSGASRTLVLADGMPLNDPFGSWVYWNRIPQAAVDRVEVVRGATGDLYGAGALGGVIQVLTVQPDHTRVRATFDGGSRGTLRGSLFAAAERNGWAGLGAYEGVETDGAYVVAPEVRGPVDVHADSDYRTGFVSAGRRTSTWHAWVRGAAYSEDRGNGTPVTVNSTDWSQVSVNAGGIVGRGALQLHLAGSSQDYYQTFSAVAADRRSERLTTKQTTDTTHRLFNGQWTRGFANLTVVAGGEFHETESTVTEFRYSITNVETGPFLAGGTETLRALFARATVMATDSLSFELGGRGDWWKSEPTDRGLPVKSVDFFSPRASVSWRQGRYALQGAVYKASRTPSLNELHRGFRAGNVVTNPNPLLNPETLTGAEVGVLTSSRTFSLRATTFFNTLKGAIANITLTQTPAQITRQRQNSDKIRARGVEVEADARVTPTLSLTAQIVFTSSHFRGSVAAPAVEGNVVPQVPTWQGGFTVTWAEPRWLTAALQMRASGRQFDDDLNTAAFILKRYAVWDVQVSRAIVRGVTAFVAVENLTDSQFDVARTPVRNIGWPRTARAGVRVAWQ